MGCLCTNFINACAGTYTVSTTDELLDKWRRWKTEDPGPFVFTLNQTQADTTCTYSVNITALACMKGNKWSDLAAMDCGSATHSSASCSGSEKEADGSTKDPGVCNWACPKTSPQCPKTSLPKNGGQKPYCVQNGADFEKSGNTWGAYSFPGTAKVLHCTLEDPDVANACENKVETLNVDIKMVPNDAHGDDQDAQCRHAFPAVDMLTRIITRFFFNIIYLEDQRHCLPAPPPPPGNGASL